MSFDINICVLELKQKVGVPDVVGIVIVCEG